MMRKINPVCKLLGLLILTFALAAARNPWLNFTAFGISLLLMAVSRVSWRTLMLLLVPVFLAAIGMFFTGYRFTAGMPVRADTVLSGGTPLYNGLTLSGRVLAYAGLGLLFAFTTDRMRLVRAFQDQLRLPQVFAYGLLAAWGIFPQMAEEYKKTRLAFRLRGLHAFPLSPAFLTPMLVKAVRWSEALAIAMESRGFSASAKRSCLQPERLCTKDKCFFAVCCVLSAAIVLFSFLA